MNKNAFYVSILVISRGKGRCSMDLKVIIGRRIKEFRLQKSLTREMLCGDESELSVRHLARIESGKSLASLTILKFIAKRLNVDIQYLTDERYIHVPVEYVELKQKLIRQPIYGDSKKIEEKIQLIEEIRKIGKDTLPLEERTALQVIEATLALYESRNNKLAKKLLNEHIPRLKELEEYTLNDLLIVNLFFLNCGLEVYDISTFNQLSKRVIQYSNHPYMYIDKIFIMQKIFLSITAIFFVKKQYKELYPYVVTLKTMMKEIQDFQQLPVITMLEAKYNLYVEKDKEKAKELYESAIACAKAFEEHALIERLKEEQAADFPEASY